MYNYCDWVSLLFVFFPKIEPAFYVCIWPDEHHGLFTGRCCCPVQWWSGANFWSIMSLMWLCLADEEINHGYLYIHVRTYLATNTSYWNWSTCLRCQLSYVHMSLIFISFSLSKTLDLLIISLLMSFHLMVFSSFCPRIFEMAPLRRSADGGAKSYFLGLSIQMWK